MAVQYRCDIKRHPPTDTPVCPLCVAKGLRGPDPRLTDRPKPLFERLTPGEARSHDAIGLLTLACVLNAIASALTAIAILTR